MAANRRFSRQDAGEQEREIGNNMSDTPKDNVFDLSKAKKASKGNKGGSDGDGTNADPKNLYYAVQPVIAIDEGERLIRLKYMTESGYFDILGIMNQMQIHNKKRYVLAQSLSILAIIISVTAIGLVIFSLV